MMLHLQGTKRNHICRSALAVLGIAILAGNANAVDIDLGNEDLKLRWDNTVRYNLGVRGERPDARILNNPTYDESDSKFGRGDVVTNRLDLLSEVDLSFKNLFGARVSAAGWYDAAYRNESVRVVVPGFTTSYIGDRYNSRVSRYVKGPSGEVLDAFLWTNLKVGTTPVNVKLGQQTNYFGEGLLIPTHAISYSQSPVDGVKAVTSPGIETKEVFLPVGQIFGKAQLSRSLSVAGQYFYDWKESRLPYGGTYFAPADPFFEGPDRLPLPGGASLTHIDSLKPKSRGNWGVSAKMSVEDIESSVGVHYRQFDDYNPWFGPNLTNFVALPGIGPVPAAYRLVYPKNVRSAGLSFARVIGSISVGSDLSYRMDGALNAAAVSPIDNEGPRGNTLHWVVNGVYLLPKTSVWDTGTVIAELAYNRLLKVTQHPELFKGKGYTGCTDPVGNPGNESDGCSSRNYVGIALSFTPQYLQVLPSWDLDIPLSINYGLKGVAASSGGGEKGSLTWSIGARMTYVQRYEFGLQYSDSRARPKYDPAGTSVVGGSGSVGTTDRGWLVFTFKTGF